MLQYSLTSYSQYSSGGDTLLGIQKQIHREVDEKAKALIDRGGTPDDPLCPLARNSKNQLSVDNTHDSSLGGDYWSPYSGGHFLRHIGKFALPTEFGRLDSREPLLACLGKMELELKEEEEQKKAQENLGNQTPSTTPTSSHSASPKNEKPIDVNDAKENPELIPDYIAFALSYKTGGGMFTYTEVLAADENVKALLDSNAVSHKYKFKLPDIAYSGGDSPAEERKKFDPDDFNRVVPDNGPPQLVTGWSLLGGQQKKTITENDLLFERDPSKRSEIMKMLNDPAQRKEAALRFMKHVNEVNQHNNSLSSEKSKEKASTNDKICNECKISTKPFWTNTKKIYEQIVRPFKSFDSSGSQDPSRGIQNLFNADPKYRLDNSFSKDYDFVRQCLNPYRPRQLKDPKKEPTEEEMAYEINRFMATYDYFRTYNQLRNKYEHHQIELFKNARLAYAPTTAATLASQNPPKSSRRGNPGPTMSQKLEGFKSGHFNYTTPTAGFNNEINVCNDYIPSARKICEDLAKASATPSSPCGANNNPLTKTVEEIEKAAAEVKGLGSFIKEIEKSENNFNIGSFGKSSNGSDPYSELKSKLGKQLSDKRKFEKMGTPNTNPNDSSFDINKYITTGDTQGATAEEIKNLNSQFLKFLKLIYFEKLNAFPNKKFFSAPLDYGMFDQVDKKQKERLSVLLGDNVTQQGNFLLDIKAGEQAKGKAAFKTPETNMNIVQYDFPNIDSKTGKFNPQARDQLERLLKQEALERVDTNANNIFDLNKVALALAGKPQESNFQGIQQSLFRSPATQLNKYIRSDEGIEADPGFVPDFSDFVQESSTRNPLETAGAPKNNAALEVSAGFSDIKNSSSSSGPTAHNNSNDGLVTALKKNDFSSLCRQGLRGETHQSRLDAAWSADLLLIPLSGGTYAGIKAGTRGALATYRALESARLLGGLTKIKALQTLFKTTQFAEIATAIKHSAQLKLVAKLQKTYKTLDEASLFFGAAGMSDIISNCFDEFAHNKVKKVHAELAGSSDHSISDSVCQSTAFDEIDLAEESIIACGIGGVFSAMMIPSMKGGLNAIRRSPTYLKLAEGFSPERRAKMHGNLMSNVRSIIDERLPESEGFFFFKRTLRGKTIENEKSVKAAKALTEELEGLAKTGKVQVKIPSDTPGGPDTIREFDLDPLHTHLVFNEFVENNPLLLIERNNRIKIFEELEKIQTNIDGLRTSVNTMNKDLAQKVNALNKMGPNAAGRSALENDIKSLESNINNSMAKIDSMRDPRVIRIQSDNIMHSFSRQYSEDFIQSTLTTAAAARGKTVKDLNFDEYFEAMKPFFNQLYSQETEGGLSRWIYAIQHYTLQSLNPQKLQELKDLIKAGGKSAEGFTSHTLDMKRLEQDMMALKSTLKDSFDAAKQKASKSSPRPTTNNPTTTAPSNPSSLIPGDTSNKASPAVVITAASTAAGATALSGVGAFENHSPKLDPNDSNPPPKLDFEALIQKARDAFSGKTEENSPTESPPDTKPTSAISTPKTGAGGDTSHPTQGAASTSSPSHSNPEPIPDSQRELASSPPVTPTPTPSTTQNSNHSPNTSTIPQEAINNTGTHLSPPPATSAPTNYSAPPTQKKEESGISKFFSSIGNFFSSIFKSIFSLFGGK